MEPIDSKIAGLSQETDFLRSPHLGNLSSTLKCKRQPVPSVKLAPCFMFVVEECRSRGGTPRPDLTIHLFIARIKNWYSAISMLRSKITDEPSQHLLRSCATTTIA